MIPAKVNYLEFERYLKNLTNPRSNTNAKGTYGYTAVGKTNCVSKM